MGGFGVHPQGRGGEGGMTWTLSGNFHDIPIEVFESKFPARLTEFGCRKDSASPDQWRAAAA